MLLKEDNKKIKKNNYQKYSIINLYYVLNNKTKINKKIKLNN